MEFGLIKEYQSVEVGDSGEYVVRPKITLDLNIEPEELSDIVSSDNEESKNFLKEINETLKFVRQEISKPDKEGY